MYIKICGKRYLKLGKIYGIGLGLGIGLVFSVIDTQRRRCTSKSTKNNRKLGNNYGIGFRVRIKVKVRCS